MAPELAKYCQLDFTIPRQISNTLPCTNFSVHQCTCSLNRVACIRVPSLSQNSTFCSQPSPFAFCQVRTSDFFVIRTFTRQLPLMKGNRLLGAMLYPSEQMISCSSTSKAVIIASFGMRSEMLAGGFSVKFLLSRGEPILWVKPVQIILIGSVKTMTDYLFPGLPTCLTTHFLTFMISNCFNS